MDQPYRTADSTDEIFSALCAEVSLLTKCEPEKFLFLFRPGKFLFLEDSQRSRTVTVRPYSQFTLAYGTQTPMADTPMDNHVEVVRDKTGTLFFREHRLVLTPSEFASKLVDLIAADT